MEDGTKGCAILSADEVSSGPPSIGAVHSPVAGISGEVSEPPTQEEEMPADVEGKFCRLCLYHR